MRYTEIRVGLKRTVNLGNYESAAFEIGLTVDVEDGDVVEITTAAYAVAAHLLTEERRRRLKGAGDAVTTEGRKGGRPVDV